MTAVLVWLWSHGGGGSEFALNLARRLACDFGNRAVALSMNAQDPVARYASAEGFDVRLANIVSHRSRLISSALGLRHAHAIISDHARAADVVVAAMNFATLAPLSLGLKKPLVYCAHDPAPHPGDYAAWGQRATQALIMRRAEWVVAHSTAAARALCPTQVTSAKLKLAPLQSVFQPTVVRHRAHDGPTRFLFAGRMIGYKGLGMLAHALDIIRDRQDWRLSVAGEGPAMSDATRQRFNHFQIDMLRSEFLSRAELEACMNDCDVVLAPYLEASQSGVVALALAHGKPCVVTPVGGLPEQIGCGEAGWIAKAVTPEAFADTLIAVLTEGVADKAAGAWRLAKAAWHDESWRWLASVGQ
jgi:glycosyltransferase involved in cell wall biosynthesis